MIKKKYYSIFIFVLALSFIFGYVVGKNKNIKNELSNNVANSSRETLAGKGNEKLKNIMNKDSNIVFKVKLNKDTFATEYEKNIQEIQDLTMKDIKEKYQGWGYKVSNMTENELEFVRNNVKYQPNKYVISIYKGQLVICVSNKDGDIYGKDGNFITKCDFDREKMESIEVSIEDLKKGDISMVTSGDKEIQFNTLEDARDRLAELGS